MSTRTGKTNPRPESEGKRNEILRAAVEVFGAKGSANGTLAEIAEHVGITHAGVLHHFGSKQNLLQEVPAFRDDDHPTDQDLAGGAFFLHLVRVAARNTQHPGLVQFYTVLSAESVTEDHPARNYFDERYRSLRIEIEDAFRELCTQENVTDTQSIDIAAASILAVMDGMQFQWLLQPSEVDLAMTSAFAIQAIVNGVLHPGRNLSSYARTR
ncbi:TetR/AcrR family transcriptional regulator [Plantibacter sp. Mn2098]|uniref:TetR/AcrR family transcriptional regulator n=1 Tax=Plantibacter sp. Mn2098 TaxID=3395266 RepID=UPI003BC5435A